MGITRKQHTPSEALIELGSISLSPFAKNSFQKSKFTVGFPACFENVFTSREIPSNGDSLIFYELDI